MVLIIFKIENSVLPSRLKVRAGGVTLISTEATEQIAYVYNIHIFPGYNHDSRLHDIAIVEVSFFYFISFFKNVHGTN